MRSRHPRRRRRRRSPLCRFERLEPRLLLAATNDSYSVLQDETLVVDAADGLVNNDTGSSDSIFTPGNILVTEVRHQRDDLIYEYTPSGGLVQTINLDAYDRIDDDRPRDIEIDTRGNLQIFDGTFSPQLTTINGVTRALTQRTHDAWNTVNDIDYGGVAAYQNYVYVTDTKTGGDTELERGIVRFDLDAGTSERFDLSDGDFTRNDEDFIDVTLGLDGFLYTLGPSGSPEGYELRKYNPDTMTLIHQVPLQLQHAGANQPSPQSNVSVAINADGEIFGIDQMPEDRIFKYAATGGLPIETFDTELGGAAAFTDIDLSPDGSQLLLPSTGSPSGSPFVYIINSDFSGTPTQFDSTADPELNGIYTVNKWGTWIPETGGPSTVVGNTSPANGNVSVSADGSFTYTPNAGFVGTDTFDYTARDGRGNESDATVTITVESNQQTVTTLVDEDNGTGDLSLREAINIANGRDGPEFIQFDPALTPNGSVTITLTEGELAITDDLTITGPGANLLTIDADGQSRIFNIDDGEAGNIDVAISGLTLTGGVAPDEGSTFKGGAISSLETLTLSDSTLSDNTATFRGGAINNEGMLIVTGSTFTGNSTSGFGGAILNDAGATATVTNSTISGNSAGFGGGISNQATGTLTVVNSTITGNSASTRGGGIDNLGTATANNTIVAGNEQGSPAVANEIAGTMEAASANNLIGDTGSAGGLSAGNNNLLGVDPLLGPLADNGGPTKTHALLVGSQAIDAGSNARAVAADSSPLTTDQRGGGFARTLDGNDDSTATVDIGAFETPLITSSIDISGGNLVIADLRGVDSTLTIQSDTTNNVFVISDPNNALGLATSIDGATGHGSGVVTVPFAAVTGSQIIVDTLDGNDSLTIDFSLGDFSVDITYNGGGQAAAGDELTLTGGTFPTVTHTFTNANDGAVSIGEGAGAQTISYVGLEPITDNLSVTDRVFTFHGGAETITLTDAAGAAMTIDSTLGESVTFANPSGSLTINAGSGDDTVTITSVDDDGPFEGALAINGDAGNDTVNLNADITFADDQHLDADLTDDMTAGDVDQINVGAGANLQLSGVGSATLKASRNISLADGSSITVVDGGITLEANQQTPATVGDFEGINAVGATLQTDGDGNIALRGRGGDDAATGFHIGVHWSDGSVVRSSDTGAITIDGTGGDGTFFNAGVWLDKSGSQVTSIDGDIEIVGSGGNGSQDLNVGVLLASGGQVNSTGTGAEAAAITINGTGGAGTSSNNGVWIRDVGSRVTSVEGDIQITGAGGSGTEHSNVGVGLASGGTVVSAGSGAGAGTITLEGMGGNGTSFNYGVDVSGNTSLIASVDGEIQITGTGGEGSGSGNVGVSLLDGGQVGSAGSGVAAATVRIHGEGGTGTSFNCGVDVSGRVTSVDGAVQITGIGGTGSEIGNIGVLVINGGRVNSTNAATVTIDGTGGQGTSGNSGVHMLSVDSQVTSDGGDVQITGRANSGVSIKLDNDSSLTATGADITLDGDDIAIDSTATVSVAADKRVTLRPETDGNAIELGSNSAGKLGLTDAELDRITAGTIQIGSANSGAITVSAAITRGTATDLELITGDQAIDFATGSLDAAGGDVTLTTGAGGHVVADSSGTDITAASLSITAGAVSGDGVGSTANPLRIEVTDLNVEASSGNGDQFLAASGTATIDARGLNAGTGTIRFDSGTFQLGGANRINDDTNIDVNGATLDLQGFAETVAAVQLTDGAINGTATLISLDTITVHNGVVRAGLAGIVDLQKPTAGRVTMENANTFTGVASVLEGDLWISDGGALGEADADSDTVVSAGAELYLSGSITVPEHLRLMGELAVGVPASSAQAEWSGPITVSGSAAIIETNDAADELTISGGISGAGALAIAGPGTVILTSDVTIDGGLDVNGKLDRRPAALDTGDLHLMENSALLLIGSPPIGVTGSVTLDANASLTASNTPISGTYTIIDNDGSDAVGGTFDGLPEGTTVPNFAGSGLDAVITYAGGDGNDVVLTVGDGFLLVDTNSDVDDGDHGPGEFSLREAIALANGFPGANEIKFAAALEGQTITLSGQQLPTITDSLTITGLGADLLTIDANQLSRIFEIDDGDFDHEMKVVIAGLTLTGGRSSHDGGAILSAENLTLTASTISENVAADEFNSHKGGGIASSGPLTVTGSTISANTAISGGGISAGGSLVVTNSTISGNVATGGLGGGGGIASPGGSVRVNGSTISGNTAIDGVGGGISVGIRSEGSLTIANSIVAGNGVVAGGSPDFDLGRVTNLTVTNSVIGDSEGTTLATAAPPNADGNGNFVGVDWRTVLANDGSNPTLQNNGGPTETIALISGSPAIDAGDPNAVAGQDGIPEFDQRGAVRVVNRLDIGAFESGIDPVITWNNPADITFGTLLDDTQLNATADVAGSFSYSPVSGTRLDAGSNQLNVLFTPDDPLTYSSAIASVSINVSKADPVVTWNDPANITFGTLLDATQLNATADVDGSFDYDPGSGTMLNAGANQTLSATFTPDSTNYNSATADVSINVLRADPVITWNNPDDITFGTQLGNTQLNATADIDGSFDYSPGVETKLNAGSDQTLSVAFTPDDAANYNNATADVALNVLKADPVITWNDPADISAGTLLGDRQLNAFADVDGSFEYSPESGTVLPIGDNQTLSVTFTPDDSANYNDATAEVSINVQRLRPVITWDDPADIIAGTPLSSVQLNATADVPGSFEYDPDVGRVLPVANGQPLIANFTPEDTTQYASTSKQVVINVVISQDYGDAPPGAPFGFASNYPVTLAQDGARHTAGELRLGTEIDVEADGAPNLQAGQGSSGGDDNTGADDEDGITFLASIVAASTPTTSSLTVHSSDAGLLDAWIDFSRDGDWDDAGEQIYASQAVVEGMNVLSFDVPGGAASGFTAARFRLSSSGGLAPTGTASDGEVEDYLVTLLDGAAAGGAVAEVDQPVTDTLDVAADESEVAVISGSIDLLRAAGSTLNRLAIAGTPGDDTLRLSRLDGVFNGTLVLDTGDGNDSLSLTGSGHHLDLTQRSVTDLAGLERIDISGSGDNTVTLNGTEVLNLGAANNTLRVISDAGDTVEIGSGWRFDHSLVDDGQFVRVYTQDEATLELIEPREWTDPQQQQDVNGNGSVEPLDALIVINELNDPQYSDPRTGSLRDAGTLDEFPGFFYDVVPDGFITPLDALVVINLLNDRAASAEGEEAARVFALPRHPSTMLVKRGPPNRGLSRADTTETERPTATPAPAESGDVSARRPAKPAASLDDLFDDLSWLNE